MGVVLALFLLSRPAVADSLLDLMDADTLATLGAPEGLSATRRGGILYPTPGLPALVHPEEEVVARVRIRRALTPPPGVQQAHVLRPWRARLIGRPAAATSGASASPVLPLTVVQVRPEDDGFAYRVRLRTLPWTPPGVYDLHVSGPGFRDTQLLAVRVVADGDQGLRLATVVSGADLAREAESLWLTDPTAVLVPGGLLEADRALVRWPVATFAVAASEESTAWRCLDLEADVAAGASEAASCPAEGLDAARCLVKALGGPSRLDPCGDGLVTYVRRAGQPVYSVGLGRVMLLGAQSYDEPPAARAAVSLRIVGRGGAAARLALPAPPAKGPASAQAEWIAAQARHADEMVLLTAEPPERWARPGEATAAAVEALSSAGPRRVIVSSRGTVDGQVVAGPATIRLAPVAPHPRRGPEQIWGLSPERYRLGAVEPRESNRFPGALVTPLATGEGLSVRIADPPRDLLRLRFVVPAGPAGWQISSDGRPARIVAAAPAHGDPCRLGPVQLVVEVDPGTSDPTSFLLEPGTASRRHAELVGPEGDRVVVGSPARFEVRWGQGGVEAPPSGLAAWDLGDGTVSTGRTIEHRYRESGWVRVCVQVVEPDGGVAEPASIDLEVLGQGVAARRSVERMGPATAVAFGALLVAGLLMLLARGNIFGTRRR